MEMDSVIITENEIWLDTTGAALGLYMVTDRDGEQVVLTFEEIRKIYIEAVVASEKWAER